VPKEGVPESVIRESRLIKFSTGVSTKCVRVSSLRIISFKREMERILRLPRQF
jgi:hypothetical protein